MITNINFLAPKITLDKLTYNIQEDPQNLPDSSSDHNDEILESDRLFYAIQNTEDLSYIQFHIKTEDNDIFIHHDIITTETILSTEIILSDCIEKYVAISGFSTTISFYDIFLFNPLEPEFKFEGHTDAVNFIKKENEILWSCSDDKNIVKWDLNERREKERILKDLPVKKILMGGSIVQGENEIFYSDEKIRFEGEIETSEIYENNLVVSDEAGNLYLHDIRYFSKNVKKKKVCEESLTDFDFYNGNILACGLDGKIALLDFNFEIVKSKYVDDQLFALKVEEEEKYCVYGGMNDEIGIYYL